MVNYLVKDIWVVKILKVQDVVKVYLGFINDSMVQNVENLGRLEVFTKDVKLRTLVKEIKN